LILGTNKMSTPTPALQSKRNCKKVPVNRLCRRRPLPYQLISVD
jgi:hypothetical protein